MICRGEAKILKSIKDAAMVYSKIWFKAWINLIYWIFNMYGVGISFSYLKLLHILDIGKQSGIEPLRLTKIHGIGNEPRIKWERKGDKLWLIFYLF